jgi:hypothetical protein
LSQILKKVDAPPRASEYIVPEDDIAGAPDISFDGELYDSLLSFVKRNLWLAREAQYHVIVCSILVSRRINEFGSVGYLFFLAPPGSGKSHGLEVIEAVAREPLPAASVTASTIFHAIEELEPDWITIDEFDSIPDESREAVTQILNSGYRKGKFVYRMIPDGRGKHALKKFKTFGCKAIASITQPADTLMSRCFLFQMTRAPPGAIPMDVDWLEVETIKRKLNDYQTRYEGTRVRDVKDFHAAEWGGNRLAEIFRAIYQVAPTKQVEDQLRSLAASMMEEQHIQEATETWGGTIITAISELVTQQSKLTDQADVISISQPQLFPLVKEKIETDSMKARFTNQQLGKHLRRLGFFPKHTRDGNCWIIGERQYRELLARFTLPCDGVTK